MKYQLSILRFAAECAIAPLLAAISGCGKADYAAKGEAALRDGKFPAAAKALETASRKAEPTTHLYYNLGAAKALSGDAAGAIRAFENAENTDLSNTDAMEYRAFVLHGKGDFLAAHELAERVLDEAPDATARARALNALAIEEHSLHRDDLACLRLASAIRDDPGYAPPYYNLARILEGTYQLHDVALANIEKFIQTADANDPRLAQAESFKNSIAKGNKPPHVTTHAAEGFIKQGNDAYARSRWTLAEQHFAKALDADPDSFEAAFGLANSRFSSRNFEAAAEAYAKAAALAPERIEPVFYQAQLAYSAGKPAKALQLLADLAVQRWPDDPRCYEIAAYAWAMQGRFYEARLYGAAFISLSKSKGANVANFEKWYATLAQLPFQPDK